LATKADLDDEWSEEIIMCFDSIAMLRIAIGEKVKDIEKHAPTAIFSDHPEVNWKGAKGMRDVIAHGYFLINYEIVHYAAAEHIPVLHSAVRAIREKLERELLQG